MLGMGWVEIFVIVVIALLVIGPDKLPEVARGLAKGLRQVQRIIGDIRDSVNLEELDAMSRREGPAERPGPSLQPARLSDGSRRHGPGSEDPDDEEDDADPYGDYDDPGDFAALRSSASRPVRPAAPSAPDPALTPAPPSAPGKNDVS